MPVWVAVNALATDVRVVDDSDRVGVVLSESRGRTPCRAVLALVRHLLERGDRVAATTRSTEHLLAGVEGSPTENLLPLEVSLTDEASVRAAVGATVDRFGRVDVVVNNAGYGYLGAVEETTDADVRRMLDVQVNGTWNVLPVMRATGSGHVVPCRRSSGCSPSPAASPTSAVAGWPMTSSSSTRR